MRYLAPLAPTLTCLVLYDVPDLYAAMPAIYQLTKLKLVEEYCFFFQKKIISHFLNSQKCVKNAEFPVFFLIFRKSFFFLILKIDFFFQFSKNLKFQEFHKNIDFSKKNFFQIF